MTRIEVCGLVIEREGGIESVPVPLTGVSVEVRIIDLVAEVCIEQRYVNRENNPIEAVYKFPLDEGAGVCRFTAEVDGRLIEGVVKETEEAKADYEEAMRTGHTAFLVEEKLPDVFKAKVGNLASGAGAKIRLTYITELKVEGGEIRFYLPTTIAPRYVPANDNSSATADLASINYTAEPSYRISFNANIKMDSHITKIRSPTHNITIMALDASRGSVRLEEEITSLDRDLVLYVQVEESNRPRLIFEKSESGTSALMLSLVPTLKFAEQKTELIFVVDRSGSMQGQGMQQAKQALTLFLHSVPIDCYINIVGFGSTHMSLFPNSLKYDDEVLTLTKAYAQNLDSDLGGTEVYEPLKWILDQPFIDGYLRQVFLLTDGEVSNVDQVISLVRHQCGNTRFFTLGLGSSASHYLVEGIARAGNGTALFATLEERLETKVMQQLQDAIANRLQHRHVKIHWEGYDKKEIGEPNDTMADYEKNVTESQPTLTQVTVLRQIPCNSNIPPIFDGRHFIVYALLEKEAIVPRYANMTANSPTGPLEVQIPLDSSNSGLEINEIIHRCAARKLIEVLQDGDESSSKKNEIVRLGCKYGLTSRYTSYVAIDPKANKPLEESWIIVRSRDIPVELPHRWHGYGHGVCYATAPAMRMMLSSPLLVEVRSAPIELKIKKKKMGIFSCFQCAKEDLHDDDDENYEDGVKIIEYENINPTTEANTAVAMGHHFTVLNDDEKLRKLVDSQSFNGAFKLESNLAELLDTTIDDLKVGVKRSEQIWVTLVALAYLNIVLPHLQTSWMLVANKAKMWLASQKELMDDDATVKAAAAERYVKAKLNL